MNDEQYRLSVAYRDWRLNSIVDRCCKAIDRGVAEACFDLDTVLIEARYEIGKVFNNPYIQNHLVELDGQRSYLAAETSALCQDARRQLGQVQYRPDMQVAPRTGSPFNLLGSALVSPF